MSTEEEKKIEIPYARVGPPPKEQLERFPGIMVPVSTEKLGEELEKYRQLALDLGAGDAKIVLATDIPQALRIYYAFCLHPRCQWVNTNLMCPQKREKVKWEDAEEFMRSYHYAVVCKILPPSEKVVVDNRSKVGPIKLDTFYTMGGGQAPDEETMVRNVIRLRMIAEIGRKVEQAAYYDGHFFAMAMGVGPCVVTWCSERGSCPGLEPGGFCLHVNSRASANAEFYIDYHLIGRKLGWGELQPGGNCTFPEAVPDFPSYYNILITMIE